MNLLRNSSETDVFISIEIPFTRILTLGSFGRIARFARFARKERISGFAISNKRSDFGRAGAERLLFLICKSCGSFMRMNLIESLFCVHEMIFLDKMNTNRAN